jgi:hypothetical protein
MTASEVLEKLLVEGCNKSHFSIHRSEHDAFCLAKRGNEWVVFYSERGQDSPPEYTSPSEDDACEFFYKLVMKQRHWHIVGFFINKSDAELLEEKLKSIGVAPIRNDIPAYKHRDDPRYRVFVAGKDIFRVREVLGEPTISYA